MYKSFIQYFVTVAFLVATVIGASVNAETQAEAYDTAAYTQFLEKSIKDLDKLYLKVIDKKTSHGEAEKAKQAYFRKTRAVLNKMNDRFDKMDVKQGASLSHTEMLVNSHITTMTLDMLASEHQPHEDKWSYAY